MINEISARSCKDLENQGAYLTDKVPNSKNSNEFDNFNMKKKKKNLSNPTVELSYQLNILNLTEPKTKKMNPCTPIRRKGQKDETRVCVCALP